MAGAPSSSRSGTSPQPPKSYLNRVFDGPSGRILCLADVRGHLSLLNRLAEESRATAIIHTGDFGFFDKNSLDRINERTLRHLLLYSPLIAPEQRESVVPKDAGVETLRASVRNSSKPLLSEFSLLQTGELKLSVPVYTVWGACEDVAILEKFRLGELEIPNLHVIDEATSRTLEIGGIKLRLLGLGGAFVPVKLFDNGEGQATIAGGQGTMWTTALQIGELVDTAQKTFDQTETRLFVSHASPGREGLLAQLALVLKADLTVSAALHFRYASSWNEFSVLGDAEAYKGKLMAGRSGFHKVWDTVKDQVLAVMDDHQKILLEKALMVSDRGSGATAGEDPAWKNTWNWNLCDAAFGHLVLDIRDGRVGAELKSQGFNYAYRRAPPTATPATATSTPAAAIKGLPSSAASPAPGASPAVQRPLSALGGSRAASQSNGVASPTPAGRASTPGAKSSPASNGTNGLNGDLGSVSAATSPRVGTTEVPGEKGGKKKPTAAEKRERKAEKEKAAAAAVEGDKSIPGSPAPSHSGKLPHRKNSSKGVISPAPSPAPAGDSEATSPVGGHERLRSPPPKRQKSPWTLYINRLPVPVSEQELKDTFGGAKSEITFVKLMWIGQGPNKVQKTSAFVEFSGEEAMRRGLDQCTRTIKNEPIGVSIAEDREGPGDGSGEGGRGGRGGFRGGRGGPPGRGGLFARSTGLGAPGMGRGGGSGFYGQRKTSEGSTANDLKSNGA